MLDDARIAARSSILQAFLREKVHGRASLWAQTCCFSGHGLSVPGHSTLRGQIGPRQLTKGNSQHVLVAPLLLLCSRHLEEKA